MMNVAAPTSGNGKRRLISCRCDKYCLCLSGHPAVLCLYMAKLETCVIILILLLSSECYFCSVVLAVVNKVKSFMCFTFRLCMKSTSTKIGPVSTGISDLANSVYFKVTNVILF